MYAGVLDNAVKRSLRALPDLPRALRRPSRAANGHARQLSQRSALSSARSITSPRPSRAFYPTCPRPCSSTQKRRKCCSSGRPSPVVEANTYDERHPEVPARCALAAFFFVVFAIAYSHRRFLSSRKGQRGAFAPRHATSGIGCYQHTRGARDGIPGLSPILHRLGVA